MSAALYSVPYVIGAHASCGQIGARTTEFVDMDVAQEMPHDVAAAFAADSVTQ